MTFSVRRHDAQRATATTLALVVPFFALVALFPSVAGAQSDAATVIFSDGPPGTMRYTVSGTSCGGPYYNQRNEPVGAGLLVVPYANLQIRLRQGRWMRHHLRPASARARSARSAAPSSSIMARVSNAAILAGSRSV